MHPGTEDISEGQDVTLLCSVQRGTLPISFTWYRTGTEGALASQTFEKLEGSYKIRSIGGEHRGGYYCKSFNPANESKRSDTVEIRGVFYPQSIEGMMSRACACMSIFVRTN